MTEREAQVMTIVGNLQRKDLFNIEKALAFKHIQEGQAATGRGYKDEAQGDLNKAKAGEAGGKARKHQSEADKLDLDYVEQSDGTTHGRETDLQNTKDRNKLATELAKANSAQNVE